MRSSDLPNFFLLGERIGSSLRGALDMVMLKRDTLGLRGVLGVLGAVEIILLTKIVVSRVIAVLVIK